MNTPRLVIGNWKMNTSRAEAISIADRLRSAWSASDVTVGVAPPFPWLVDVKKQLDALDKKAEETYAKFFRECSQKERETLLLKFSDSTNKDEKEFFTLMKSETIRGFNTSQKVMEDYLGYKVAPGYYHGCVPV